MFGGIKNEHHPLNERRVDATHAGAGAWGVMRNVGKMDGISYRGTNKRKNTVPSVWSWSFE